MPLGAVTNLKVAHHCPLSPVARWEPNPTWIVEPSEYRIELELPPNSAPLESLEVVVTQYRRVNHDEIRVSIMKNYHYLWSMYFRRGEIDPSEEEGALKASLETGKLVIKIRRL